MKHSPFHFALLLIGILVKLVQWLAELLDIASGEIINLILVGSP
ncbi:hypothetical protein SAMN04488029_0315 [Reichenbachiella faecimaris]|uniref:Uncharacterized protein n=1 Tax=Reichenbachiella faecimaris TaxID=692418 RepID=A0A1W2G5N6_REIFA|nr:hypothetical protein SAMN04488029_0315 [Reichenbachiella faecimaris]